MKMHAYDEMYMGRAARVLGNVLHAAVIDQKQDGDEFLQKFMQSGIAEEFETGNPKYVAGKSGAELFMDVQMATEGHCRSITIEHYERTAVYWAGWMLARYQWYSGKSFADILDTVTFQDFLYLYPTMHEADPEKCYEVLDMHFEHLPSRLKTMRKRRHLTQEALAASAGVSLNTIRAYERRSKDINKAQADILRRLSKTLGCSIEELLD